MNRQLLNIQNLNIEYNLYNKILRAVTDLSFSVYENEILGIVGESGSGKSQAMLAIMGLLNKRAKIRGSIKFDNQELISLSEVQLNKIHGSQIGIIFQDPMTSLNPYLKISSQMTEMLIVHAGMNYKDARTCSIEMLDRVRIRDAKNSINLYPHELSGGMRQRVMIAMTLLGKPKLLIADEPTTALDVTVQADILGLLRELKESMQMAIIFITHDIAVAANLCDRLNVMYCGSLMETGLTKNVLSTPQHQYTQALLATIASLNNNDSHLAIIPGEPPNLASLPRGCPFQTRCNKVILPNCQQIIPIQKLIEHESKCIHPMDLIL